jgi:hypothetical protein
MANLEPATGNGFSPRRGINVWGGLPLRLTFLRATRSIRLSLFECYFLPPGQMLVLTTPAFVGRKFGLLLDKL